MIIDCHAHVFPPAFRADRERLASLEPLFRELYDGAPARLATADDLLRSLDRAGIDVSVALGFAWLDLDTCRRHNDYLLQAAAESDGRVVAFCNLPLACGPAAIEAEARRCLAAGARGFGELRPENQGCDLAGAGGDALAAAVAAANVPLLFHVSEPVGRAYPGKEGLALASFAAFVAAHPGVKTVGAHWGGGLPFYALMPEVAAALETTYFDTAASSLLYGPAVYEQGVALAGAEHVLFGSDYPLLSQSRSRRRIEVSGLEEEAKRLVLGESARRLLHLE